MAEVHSNEVEQAYLEYYPRLGKGPPPPLSAHFYPYRNLNHTIRVRDGRVFVRISDILHDAPGSVLAALTVILLHKIFRRKSPAAPLRVYRAWVEREDVARRTHEVRSARSRKQLTSPVGQVFDLTPLFDQLNARYFEGELRVKSLSWSRRKSRRNLGHYDPVHDAVIVSKRLDHPLVPQFVVEFVLYHEMLHVAFRESACQGRRRVHHAEFRRAEKRFGCYLQAKRFIKAHS